MDDGSSATCYALALAGLQADGAPQLVYAAGRGGMEVLDGVTGAHVSWYPAGFGPAYAVVVGRPDLFGGGAFGLVARHGAEHADGRSGVRAESRGTELTRSDRSRVVGAWPSASLSRPRLPRAAPGVRRPGPHRSRPVDEVLGPERGRCLWERGRQARESPSGSYFVRLEADGRSQVKRIVLTR